MSENNNNNYNSASERLAELEKILADYSRELYENNREILSQEEYDEIFFEYEELINRPIARKKEHSFWDEINPIIFLVGILQIIISLPWIMYDTFSILSLTMLDKIFANARIDNWIPLSIFGIFLFPIIFLLISWIIFNYFVKGKNNRILFIILWIIQFVIILSGGLYLIWPLIRGY